MADDTIRHKDRITQDPAVLVGKPVVKGSRISVELVLGQMALDPTLGELFAGYPELTIEDVEAVLAFARDAVRADYLRSRERKEALAAAKSKAPLGMTA